MLQTVLLQIGLVMLWRFLAGKEDSSKVEEAIIYATGKDEMIEVIAGAAISKALHDKGLDGATEAMIEDLVATRDKKELVTLLNRPEAKKTIVDMAFGLLESIFGIFDFIGRRN